MLVKELIDELQSVDGDRLVVLASDEEQNSVAPLEGGYECGYAEDDECTCIEKLTEDAIKDGYTEDDLFVDHVKAYILTP